VAAGIPLRPPTLPLYSNLNGARAGSEMASADYWVRHARQAVRFGDGIAAMIKEQTGILLEVGPGATLAGLSRRGRTASAPALASLYNGRSERRSIAQAVSELWRAGVAVNMDRFLEHRGGRRRALPTYPFQRERHWADVAMGRQRTGSDGARRESFASTALPGISQQWLYRLEWRPTPHSPPPPSATRTWILLADRGGLAEQLATRLRSRGENCTLVDVDCAVRDLPQLLAESPTHVVHCPGVDVNDDGPLSAALLLQAEQRLCGSLLQLAQALASAPLSATPQLTVLTRGAMTVPGDTHPPAIVSAPVVALGRAIATELPRLNCACIDLDPGEIDFEALCAELVGQGRDDLVALRGATRLVARLAAAAAVQSAASEVLEPDATYLITGGLGALGIRVARSFVERGARHLALIGRHEPSSDVAVSIHEMTQAGAEIRVFNADVGDTVALQTVFDSIRTGMPRLRGIVHAAGVLDDGVLEQQSWQRFARVMHPKLGGAWNLHLLSEKIPLRFFTMFSSAAALLGSSGQSNYCAANAFLDALAHYRRQHGLPAVSIGWGGWAQAGMAAAQDPATRSGRNGIALLQPTAALAVLHAVLADSPPHLGVVDIDWQTLLSHFPVGRHPPLFEQFAHHQRVPVTVTSLSEWLQSSQPGSESSALIDYVRQCLGAVLGRDADQIDPDVPLLDLGLDSLLAIELRNRIETTGGPALTLARFLDGADARRIAALITERLPSPPGAVDRQPPDAALIELVASMSDAEIEAQLASLAQGPT
jgi:acyl transferase domain-containing protein/aryl carrier-like protein